MSGEQMALPLRKRAPRRIVFQSPLVIVCEGLADRAFFRKFLVSRNVSHYEVPFPHDPSADDAPDRDRQITGGASRFPEMLRAVKLSEVAKAVLLVLDTADNVDSTLATAVAHIREAADYNIPTRIMELAPANGEIPAIAIATIPPNEPGGLEVPCYNALVRTKQEIAQHIDVLCTASGVTNWNPEKQGKARLQCAIAVLNHEDPNKSLRRIFERTIPIIPLSDSAFDPIEGFLREFARLAGFSA